MLSQQQYYCAIIIPLSRQGRKSCIRSGMLSIAARMMNAGNGPDALLTAMLDIILEIDRRFRHASWHGVCFTGKIRRRLRSVSSAAIVCASIPLTSRATSFHGSGTKWTRRRPPDAGNGPERLLLRDMGFSRRPDIARRARIASVMSGDTVRFRKDFRSFIGATIRRVSIPIICFWAPTKTIGRTARGRDASARPLIDVRAPN